MDFNPSLACADIRIVMRASNEYSLACFQIKQRFVYCALHVQHIFLIYNLKRVTSASTFLFKVVFIEFGSIAVASSTFITLKR